MIRDDEEPLTAAIIRLASTYGRYGYRRITALLRADGWRVNLKRVYRIWRREGLKVPQKQPKRGRLWLNDGSCVRLRPERPGHVWSYDFVQDCTQDGRTFRMLTVIDEFTRGCLAIVVARRLNSDDVLHCLAELFTTHRPPEHIRFRQWQRVHRQGGARLAQPDRGQDALHRARQPLGERLQRELQR